MSGKNIRCHPIRALNRGRLAHLERDLRLMDKFYVTVRRPWLSIKFPVRALKRFGAGVVRTRVSRMPIATIGKEPALHCNWLGSVWKTAVFTHRFVGKLFP